MFSNILLPVRSRLSALALLDVLQVKTSVQQGIDPSSVLKYFEPHPGGDGHPAEEMLSRDESETKDHVIIIANYFNGVFNKHVSEMVATRLLLWLLLLLVDSICMICIML